MPINLSKLRSPVQLKLDAIEQEVLRRNGVLYKKIDNDGNRIRIFPKHVDDYGNVGLTIDEVLRPTTPQRRRR